MESQTLIFRPRMYKNRRLMMTQKLGLQFSPFHKKYECTLLNIYFLLRLNENFKFKKCYAFYNFSFFFFKCTLLKSSPFSTSIGFYRLTFNRNKSTYTL